VKASWTTSAWTTRIENDRGRYYPRNDSSAESCTPFMRTRSI
jgi:hypothetical protein